MSFHWNCNFLCFYACGFLLFRKKTTTTSPIQIDLNYETYVLKDTEKNVNRNETSVSQVDHGMNKFFCYCFTLTYSVEILKLQSGYSFTTKLYVYAVNLFGMLPSL